MNVPSCINASPLRADRGPQNHPRTEKIFCDSHHDLNMIKSYAITQD